MEQPAPPGRLRPEGSDVAQRPEAVERSAGRSRRDQIDIRFGRPGSGARRLTVAGTLYDAEEQRIVAYEFDAGFRYLAETRVHVAEWIGDEALQEGFAAWTWS